MSKSGTSSPSTRHPHHLPNNALFIQSTQVPQNLLSSRIPDYSFPWPLSSLKQEPHSLPFLGWLCSTTGDVMWQQGGPYSEWMTPFQYSILQGHLKVHWSSKTKEFSMKLGWRLKVFLPVIVIGSRYEASILVTHFLLQVLTCHTSPSQISVYSMERVTQITCCCRHYSHSSHPDTSFPSPKLGKQAGGSSGTGLSVENRTVSSLNKAGYLNGKFRWQNMQYYE